MAQFLRIIFNTKSTYFIISAFYNSSIILYINSEVIFVECKATNNSATSMKYVISHPEKYGKYPAIKISYTNIGFGEGFQTYPLYYPGFLQRKETKLILPWQDFSKLTIPE